MSFDPNLQVRCHLLPTPDFQEATGCMDMAVVMGQAVTEAIDLLGMEACG